MKYSIMTNVRNEKDLLEWCIYHIFILKFDKLYICDNESSPSVKDTLRNNRLKEEIKTELNNKVQVFTIPGPGIKNKARQEFFNKYRNECDWTLFLDADEYLVLKTADNIHDFMNKPKFKNIDCVVFNWKMIGTNGIHKRNNKLVIENFTDCYSTLSTEIKPFVNNKKIIHMGNHPHIVPIQNPHNVVNTDGQKHDILNDNYSCYNNNINQKDCIFHFHWKSKEDFDCKVKTCKNNGGLRDDGQQYNSLTQNNNRPLHERTWSDKKLPHNDYYLLLNYSKKIKNLLKPVIKNIVLTEEEKKELTENIENNIII